MIIENKEIGIKFEVDNQQDFDKWYAIRKEQIRADAIEEFAKDIINKINFEDKWLLDCKSNNADTNIMFSALRSFVNNRVEQLKEQKNENKSQR